MALRATALLALCSVTAAAPEQRPPPLEPPLERGAEPQLATLVETPLGKVQGFVGKQNTLEWRGIPYAQP